MTTPNRRQVSAPRSQTRFSSVMDVARILNVGRSTVYRMLDDGTLPFYRFGKNVIRIPTAAVWDYLRGARVDPAKFDLSPAL